MFILSASNYRTAFDQATTLDEETEKSSQPPPPKKKP
jgi:hypothetical protein